MKKPKKSDKNFISVMLYQAGLPLSTMNSSLNYSLFYTPPLPPAGAGMGAPGDVLTSRQRKELDASMLRNCFSQTPRACCSRADYKQNLCSLRSLPRRPGGRRRRRRRWRRGRGCAWQDGVYLLPLAQSRGGPGPAQVPGGRALPLFPHPQCRLHPRGRSTRSPAADSG